MGLLSRLLGEGSEREIRRLEPIVQEINQLEPEMERLSAEGLRAKTDEFRARISEALDGVAGEPRKAAAPEGLDDPLPPPWASAWRRSATSSQGSTTPPTTTPTRITTTG